MTMHFVVYGLMWELYALHCVGHVRSRSGLLSIVGLDFLNDGDLRLVCWGWWCGWNFVFLSNELHTHTHIHVDPKLYMLAFEIQMINNFGTHSKSF